MDRPLLAVLLGLAAAAPACGGASRPPEQLLADLRRAVMEPVGDADTSAAHSRLVEEVADSDALTGLRRHEVEEAIGRGSPCSQHPHCGEQGFEADDWFYAVGEAAEGYPERTPELIVGFDREGRVNRTWNLRTHDLD